VLREDGSNRFWLCHRTLGLSVWDYDSGKLIDSVQSTKAKEIGDRWTVNPISANMFAIWKDNLIELVDIGEKKSVRLLEDHDDDVTITSVIPLGEDLLASTSSSLKLGSDNVYQSSLCIWNRKERMLIKSVSTFKSGAAGVISIGKDMLVCWSSNPNNTELMVFNNELELVCNLKGHTDRIWGARKVSENLFVSWSADGDIRLWSTEKLRSKKSERSDTNQIAASSQSVSKKQEHSIHMITNDTEDFLLFGGGVTISSAARALVWTRDNNSLELFDLNDGRRQITIKVPLKGKLSGAVILDSQTLLSWARGDSVIQVWNSISGDLIFSININPEDTTNVGISAISGNNKEGIGLDEGGNDTKSNEEEAVLDDLNNPLLLLNTKDSDNMDEDESNSDFDINSLFEATFEENPYGLIVADSEFAYTWEQGSQSLLVWDLLTGTHLYTLSVDTDGIKAVSPINRDSTCIWYESGEAVILNVKTSSLIDVPAKWDAAISGFTFQPNGSQFSWSIDSQKLKLEDRCPETKSYVSDANKRCVVICSDVCDRPLEWHSPVLCELRFDSGTGTYLISEKTGNTEYETVCVKLQDPNFA